MNIFDLNNEEYTGNEDIIETERAETISEYNQQKETKENKTYDSLGINIGSLNTVYSIFGKKEGRFQTNVLLSDISKRVIPSQICYSDTHRLYGDTASSKMGMFSYTSYANLSRLLGFNIFIFIFIFKIIFIN